MPSNKPIYVHNPCTKNWDNLSGQGCTRFCSKCQNEVHDLTHENDKAIKTFIISKKGKICAKVTNEQVQGVLGHMHQIWQKHPWFSSLGLCLWARQPQRQIPSV